MCSMNEKVTDELKVNYTGPSREPKKHNYLFFYVFYIFFMKNIFFKEFRIFQIKNTPGLAD